MLEAPELKESIAEAVHEYANKKQKESAGVDGGAWEGMNFANNRLTLAFIP